MTFQFMGYLTLIYIQYANIASVILNVFVRYKISLSGIMMDKYIGMYYLHANKIYSKTYEECMCVCVYFSTRALFNLLKE